MMRSQLSGRAVIAACWLLAASSAAAGIPGWQEGWPTPDQMLQGHDPAQVQQFMTWSAALEKNPRDSTALDSRAYYDMEFARKGNYGVFWRWLAAKDLEQAIQVNPNDFYAWHNYGDLNFNSGDLWMMNDHSNAKRAVWAFTKAIALNAQSARSYMGRGWAYLTMDDQQDANADFDRAVQLDPSLKQSIISEIGIIEERKRQEAAARGTVQQMARYYVVPNARNENECAQAHGLWTQGECRVSMAMYPGPTQPWEHQQGGGGSLR